MYYKTQSQQANSLIKHYFNEKCNQEQSRHENP